MRIGVNALYLIPGGVGGTEIYLRCLLKALAEIDSHNEYIIFTNSETSHDLVPKAVNFTHAPEPVRATFRPGRIMYEQLVLPVMHEADVMFNPGFTAPLLHSNNVTVFHDLQHKRHPENFRWFDLPFWNLLLWASAKRSQRLISVSEATRQDLKKYYEVDSTVVHHGVDPKFFDIATRRAPEDFLLCVSTLHPHKNIDRLVRAFAVFRKDNPNTRLVLAGMRGFYTEAIEAEIARCGLKESVEVTGWLAQDDLFDLYRRAKAFVYPSRFEGFGMPVLEALAAGIPLACSDIEPMRSLVQNDAVLFDPESDETVAAALNQLIDKPPAPNQRIRSFTWRQTAEDTLRVLIR